MRAGQAGPALGVKTGLVAPVTVRVYFTRPRAGTDRTNGRSWLNQKPLHRGSRTCRPFAPNQSHFKEDRGFIDWLDAPTWDVGDAGLTVLVPKEQPKIERSCRRPALSRRAKARCFESSRSPFPAPSCGGLG